MLLTSLLTNLSSSLKKGWIELPSIAHKAPPPIWQLYILGESIVEFHIRSLRCLQVIQAANATLHASSLLSPKFKCKKIYSLNACGIAVTDWMFISFQQAFTKWHCMRTWSVDSSSCPHKIHLPSSISTPRCLGFNLVGILSVQAL